MTILCQYIMPVVEEDGPPVDDGAADHDKDGNKSIVAKRAAQQGRATNISFDERFKALMCFKYKFGNCNVPKTKFGKYRSLGKWCNQTKPGEYLSLGR